MNIGIWGLGCYLPPTVRSNDWWSPEIVADWHERMAHQATRANAPEARAITSGMRRTLAALAEFASDPFRGAVERRVMADDMTTSDMEARAAREAIERAGIHASEIGAILTQTPVPEHPMVNGACPTHARLGLPQRCIALGTEGACNAFALHVSLAHALIASGQARFVLSVHSSAITRVHGPSEPHSAWWGDGAAAVVLGPVSRGRGVLAAVHNADGARCDALALGVPGRNWWEHGSVTTYSPNRESTRDMLFGMVDRGGAAIREAMKQADVSPAQVGFYASHQSTPWLTRETAAEAGLERVPTIVTFPKLGNMNSVNVPAILAMGERERLIRDDSIVATFSGGIGETWSSLILRWGR
jgi:3-oxoacyl-[acyl-carrier-protein] synthase-3